MYILYTYIYPLIVYALPIAYMYLFSLYLSPLYLLYREIIEKHIMQDQEKLNKLDTLINLKKCYSILCSILRPTSYVLRRYVRTLNQQITEKLQE